MILYRKTSGGAKVVQKWCQSLSKLVQVCSKPGKFVEWDFRGYHKPKQNLKPKLARNQQFVLVINGGNEAGIEAGSAADGDPDAYGDDDDDDDDDDNDDDDDDDARDDNNASDVTDE